MSRKDPNVAALDLLRRLPPHHIRRNVTDCVRIHNNSPALLEHLLGSVDPGLRTRVCASTHKPYIICEYNRDGDLFRSPWSNVYDGSDTAASAGYYQPSPPLRTLEIDLNEIFAEYTKLYFGTEGVVVSSYVWETDVETSSFAVMIGIHKDSESHDIGTWDSVHVIACDPHPDDSTYYTYTLTTTIILKVKAVSDNTKFRFSGNVTKVSSTTTGAASDHIVNIGNLVQSHENKFRRKIENIYFAKPSEVCSEARSRVAERHVMPLPGMAPPVDEAAPKKRKKNTLPDGWMKVRNDEDGSVYYYNENTGESSWEKPTGATVNTSAPQQPPPPPPPTTTPIVHVDPQPQQQPQQHVTIKSLDILIGGLPREMAVKEVRSLLEEQGCGVSKCSLIVSKSTGQPTGIARVSLKDKKSVVKALGVQGKKMYTGDTLVVEST
eukprot:PhF_6_TR32146/c1_g1_i1/m.47631/K10365/CAPZB; capping protein (actin filament) muscle Z-line, beta